MISIIIPTLNEESYIENILRSLSSYPSVDEILIVDALSTDLTREKVLKFKNSFARKDLRIEIVTNPYKLQGFALNKGIEKANNEFVIRIDAHSVVNKYEKIDHFSYV